MKKLFLFLISGFILSNMYAQTPDNCVTGSDGGTPAFDCGLATESMFVAAHGLGLGDER